jgi:hypothetical protein
MQLMLLLLLLLRFVCRLHGETAETKSRRSWSDERAWRQLAASIY